MSVGQVIGGAVGTVAGFFIGGPIGAVVGGTLGVGVGGFIDPAPVNKLGEPDLQELSITTAKEGDVIPDLLGISKIKGNILSHWGNTSEEIKQSVGGKGGGGGDVTTGYKYYLSWIQGICIGPVDTLRTIYKGEDPVWAGKIERPVSGGQETISLFDYSDNDGNGTLLGTVTFYFGTNDHALNSDFEDGLSDSTLNIPYRNLCYAYFDNILLGEANRVPVYSFVIEKRPVLAFNSNETINTFDYNPAHALWWIIEKMTDLPTSFIDTTTFDAVADTLYDEDFGVSILFNKATSANDYINNILFHIGAIKYYDTDAKLKLKLIRKDEDESNMISLSDDDFVEKPAISRGSWYETTNEIHGIYPQRIITAPEAANLFFMDSDLVWGAFYNGHNLVYTGGYVSSETMYSMMDYDDDILLQVEKDTNAEIRRLNITPVGGVFSVDETYTPYNQYDVTGIYQNLIQGRTSKELIFNDEDGKYVVLNDFVRESRGYYTTVVQGTDSNYYWKDSSVLNIWDSNYRPITGSLWSSHWTKIQDGLVDSPVSVWGVGSNPRPGEGLQNCSRIYNGYLYTGYNKSPNNLLYKVNLSSLTVETWISEVLLVKRMEIGLGKLYCIGGNFTVAVRKLNLGTLAIEETSVNLDGWFGDITVVGDYVVAVTKPYTGNSGIYLLDADTLAILDSVINTDDNDRVLPVENISNHFIVGTNERYIHAYKIVVNPITFVATLELVDSLRYPGGGTASCKELVAKTIVNRGDYYQIG